jgi:hypothetical protein
MLCKGGECPRDMFAQLQRNYDSKDTGFLAMPAATLLSASPKDKWHRQRKKRLALDSMKSKVSSPPFYGMWF